MKKKGKIITTIITTLLIVVAIMAGALQVGKAEDTPGKITISKKAVATSDRKAKVTLEIHTSELKQSTADIIFVMDHSSSMNYEVCTKYETTTWVDRWGREHTEKKCVAEDSRLEVAKDAAADLVDELIPNNNTGNVRVGFISFGTYYESDNSIALTKDKAAVKAKINSLKEKSNNGTNVHAGLNAAKNQLASSTAETKIIILLLVIFSIGSDIFFDITKAIIIAITITIIVIYKSCDFNTSTVEPIGSSDVLIKANTSLTVFCSKYTV